MSSSKKKASGKSYLKIIACMLIGAVFGAVLSIISSMGYESIRGGTRAALGWLGDNSVWFFWIFLMLATVYGLLHYKHMKTIGNRMQEAEDEEADDLEYVLDRNYGIFGILTNVIIFMGLFLMVVSADRNFSDNKGETAVWILLPFLLMIFIQCAMQIRVVRLLQTLDPMKKGDPSDISFEKDWLASCDEAEREILYQASYHANRVLSVAIMALTVLAVLCHMMWNTGLFAVAVLAVLGILQTAVVQLYSLRLQKKKLRG